MGRRHVLVGHRHDGTPVTLGVRGRPVLIAGEPGSGKSWLAGLLCEQLILQGYCLCVIDPEGDYASLEALPGVILLGGDDPPPTARELTRALRHPDVSIVVDLSKMRHREKLQYVEKLMDLLLRLRRQTGLPHRIVVDEAHYVIARKPAWVHDLAELRGLTLITYRLSTLAETMHLTDLIGEAVVLVTRESDPQEIQSLRGVCTPSSVPAEASPFTALGVNEAAILPGPQESCGCVVRFEIAPRLTTHVRHRTKYLDMPVLDEQAFVFSDNRGRAVARARTLKEFVGFIASLAPAMVDGHLRRHDFSRWIEEVFRDGALASRVRESESDVGDESTSDIVAGIDQAIRARYEDVPSDISTRVRPKAI